MLKITKAHNGELREETGDNTQKRQNVLIQEDLLKSKWQELLPNASDEEENVAQ